MTVINKDKIFATRRTPKPFEFNQDVANVFDDMIYRSVPFYKETQKQILNFIKHLVPDCKNIMDLGCSTGTTLFFLDENLQKPNISYTGIDNSESMLKKARDKAHSIHSFGKINFLNQDILSAEFKNTDVVIINYVLQFLSPEVRLNLLKKIYNEMNSNGILILSEKTQPQNSKINKAFIENHEAFKKKNHYSHLEIAQKRKALENVLIPFSLEENLRSLENAGFKNTEPFLTWNNFSSIICIKD